MKIGVISSVYGSPWAGSEELWYQTSLKALEKRHEVKASVFEVYDRCSQFENFKSKGGSILFRKRFRNGRVHMLKHKFVSAFSSLFKWQPDVIILSLGGLPDLMLYPDLLRHLQTNREVKIILICLFNSDNTAYDENMRRVVGFFCERAAHLVFVSENNFRLAERQLAMKFKNVTVFSSPVSYLDSYHSLDWPKDDTVLKMACVARLDVQAKGQDILLASLAEPQWRERKWHLSIYGKGADEEYIRSLVKLYDLTEHVSFTGFTPDTREIWKTHHMMVMASRAEGLSLAILEAMICGRICVVSDVGDSDKVITDSHSGFLSEGPQPKYFGAALERAWNNRNQFRQIALNAMNSVSRVFQDSPVEKLLTIIEKK